jgi:putative redox protein
LSSCMITIMGIVADREKIDLTGLTSEIVKIMSSSPRKIAEIQITFNHPNLFASDEQKQKLKHAALTCPVALSLSESLKQTVEFNF